MKNTQLSRRFNKMSKDNTERGKRRVTRTGGVPQVEWQTGRREGQPVRIDNVERESTTAEDVFFKTTMMKFTWTFTKKTMTRK